MAQHYTRTLNHLYLQTPALWQDDFSWEGFRWIAADDTAQSIISFRRIDKKGNEVVVVCNFTPIRRDGYRIGLPVYGEWAELFNSDLAEFGGGNVSNGPIKTDPIPYHGFEQSAALTLPPLSVLVLKKKRARPYPKKKAEKLAKADTE